MSEMIKILVADKLAKEGLDYLQNAGDVAVDVKVGLSEDELAAVVGEYDGLIVRSGAQVTAKVLAEPGRLRGVCRAGVGVDNIDLPAATSRGVLVMNSAEATTITTAELAFSLLMALARNIGPAYKSMTEGAWDKSKFVGRQLGGKTLGVVGFGRIGRTVAERALAFDMKVLAFDPLFAAATACDGRVKMFRNVDDMLGECDFLSFHCPLNDQTRGMLNPQRFALCKDGVLVVNAARGGIVDTEALIEALDSGKCGGAAIDVFEEEPLPGDSPLRTHPKIVTTPHLGASTAEAQAAVSKDACAQLLEYLRGEGLRGAVNIAGVRFDLDPVQMQFVDLAQRMGMLIAPMCEEGVGTVTVTVIGSQLRGAASTVERMAAVALLTGQVDPPVNVINVGVVAEERGIKLKSVAQEDGGEVQRLVIEVEGGTTVRRIVGTVYADGQPRILQIGSYHMDIVPGGPMILLLNQDQPGMIGLVGTEMGNAGVNIADMAITRAGDTAMMLINIDEMPANDIIDTIKRRPGILKVAAVMLPPLNVDS
jgi:D-3-phosphoglycerate dehydrogenase